MSNYYFIYMTVITSFVAEIFKKKLDKDARIGWTYILYIVASTWH